MAAPNKRSFASFIKRDPGQIAETAGRYESPAVSRPDTDSTPGTSVSPTGNEQHGDFAREVVQDPQPRQTSRGHGDGEGRDSSTRQRVVTSTGRVRTYTASRNLPGVTLRLTEERWERLKLLSVQERRPIQEILGEALDAYMKGRGLRW